VLLISPGIIKWTDMDFGLPHLVSMAGWLKQTTGVRVEILDLNYEGGDHDHLIRTIDSLGPHLVIGLSTFSSFDYRRVMALAGVLRQHYPDVPLVTGGYHASALPDDVVFDGSPFTSVVLGEGELPMQKIVETLLGGGTLDRVYPAELIQDLDVLPMYDWSALDRYWPRAKQIGKKFQIFLSRGCPYHCTFCMERSKSGYSWRAYTPERAVAELERLATHTDLSHWVVNVADPLFGFKRRWRRTVLEGIAKKGLFPRSYWTLTRSDDLQRDDLQLLADARFAIGIGLESGAPDMLKTMQKGNKASKYLDAVRRLARLSDEVGLTWASNLIIGHPGETPETMAETAAFIRELFLSRPVTRGWLSVDPFRLYPGSYVHEVMAHWEARYGARFFHKAWWRSWYSASFRAEHLDPSSTVDFRQRVDFMHATYAPILEQIAERFVGQGRPEVDGVWRASIDGQRRMLSATSRERTLQLADFVEREDAQATRDGRVKPGAPEASVGLAIPVGLQIRDPKIRQREGAVRRLLDGGVLRTEALIDALLQVPPEEWMPEDVAAAMLGEAPPLPPEGLLPVALPFRVLAMGLEALEPHDGAVVVDAAARSGYVAAVLAHLVGPNGRVLALRPQPGHCWSRVPAPQVEAIDVPPAQLLAHLRSLDARFDRIWFGATLPRLPAFVGERLAPGGRIVTSLGPRFRPQDLVVRTRADAPDASPDLEERVVARVRVPVYGGSGGWIASPPAVDPNPTGVRIARWEAPALAAHVLAHLDLGADAASTFDPSLPDKPWVAPLLEAYRQAPGHLLLQVVGLQYRDVGALIDALRFDPPVGLSDPRGRVLAARFADALQHEADAVGPVKEQTPEDPALTDALKALAALRQALWAPQGRSAPPLVILDTPALGPHGRATQHGQERRVAVSLAQPPEHVLCQVLHEEMHPITDPVVLRERKARQSDDTPRSTRTGDAGFGLHAELEAVAVQATEAFLQARSPEWLPAFERWRQRWSPTTA
jgi:radical SAM superfamily enzyme YgiQ (UPF0313 family)/protein-L-isoaspartate O-methyltransferase